MSKHNGQSNGHSSGNSNGQGDGEDRANVASFEDARRRAAAKAKAEKRAASGISRPQTARDWLIGGLIVAMALGYIASFFIGTEPVTTGGVQ